MKRVFTSSDTAELSLLKNILKQAGIWCVELNEQMAQTIPSAPFQAELWVENEADYPAAIALVEEWQRPITASGPVWTCRRCGQQLGNQFGHCWKCGSRRDAGT